MRYRCGEKIAGRTHSRIYAGSWTKRNASTLFFRKARAVVTAKWRDLNPASACSLRERSLRLFPASLPGPSTPCRRPKKFRGQHRLKVRSDQRFFLRTFRTTATAGHKLPKAWNFRFGISPLTKHSMGNQFTPLVMLTTFLRFREFGKLL